MKMNRIPSHRDAALAMCVVAILCVWSVPLVASADELRPVANFFKLPNDWTLGACSAVATNAKGEIIVFHRGPHPLLVFNAGNWWLR